MEKQTENGATLPSHDLLGLSLTEAAEAIEVFKRVHALIYVKMGSRLMSAIQERGKLSMEDPDQAREYARGFKDGREAGMQTWPCELAEFSVVEVVQAIRGPNA